MKNLVKKQIKACVLLAIALIFLPIAVEYTPIYMGRFSPERWEKHPNHRHRMTRNMERKIGIRNLSQDEIIEILGTNRVHINGSDSMSYSIWYPLSIMGIIADIILYYPLSYHIIFDSDGKVVSTYTYRS